MHSVNSDQIYFCEFDVVFHVKKQRYLVDWLETLAWKLISCTMARFQIMPTSQKTTSRTVAATHEHERNVCPKIWYDEVQNTLFLHRLRRVRNEQLLRTSRSWGGYGVLSLLTIRPVWLWFGSPLLDCQQPENIERLTKFAPWKNGAFVTLNRYK